jgi:hypothetical protein
MRSVVLTLVGILLMGIGAAVSLSGFGALVLSLDTQVDFEPHPGFVILGGCVLAFTGLLLALYNVRYMSDQARRYFACAGMCAGAIVFGYVALLMDDVVTAGRIISGIAMAAFVLGGLAFLPKERPT